MPKGKAVKSFCFVRLTWLGVLLFPALLHLPFAPQVLEQMLVVVPHPQKGALHGQTNGSGQLSNELGSALPVIGALCPLLQGLGAPAKVIHRAPPGLLHLGQEFPLLGPIFVGHAVAERVGCHMPFVDQLLAFFVWKLGSHHFPSVFFSLLAWLARLPALPVNLFPPRLLFGA